MTFKNNFIQIECFWPPKAAPLVQRGVSSFQRSFENGYDTSKRQAKPMKYNNFVLNKTQSTNLAAFGGQKHSI